MSDTQDERPEVGPPAGKQYLRLTPSQIHCAGSRNTNIGFTIYRSRPQKRQSPLKVIWEMIFLAFMDETRNPKKWITRPPSFKFGTAALQSVSPVHLLLTGSPFGPRNPPVLARRPTLLRHESSPLREFRVLIRFRAKLGLGLLSAAPAWIGPVQPWVFSLAIFFSFALAMMAISTRRFICCPCAVSLVATGCISP